MQTIIATSTCQAEYISLYQCTREIVYLRRLLFEFDSPCREPTPIHEDNQSAQALASNPVHHERTKHFDVKYNYTREQLEKSIIAIVYCPTKDQLADLLTKGLTRVDHARLSNRMLIIDPIL